MSTQTVLEQRSTVARQERQEARKERSRLLLRRPAFLIGSFILLVWAVCAIGGTKITPFDPIQDRGPTSARPGGEHLLGTDKLGRDVLSRVMAGARDVLIAAPLAALIAIFFGTLIGLCMGYFRGIVDDVLSRIVEAVLAIPLVLSALLVTTMLGKSRLVVIGTVAVLFIPIVARTVRSAVMGEAQLDYVTAARLRGESSFFIMTREILPNVTGPIIVEFTVRVGYAIFTIATLSFLGAGLQPPSPDWGLTISDNYNLINAGQWWPAVFPALAIASLVIAVNLVADSIEAVYAA
jgi:peptide/nickel transport system permease protein